MTVSTTPSAAAGNAGAPDSLAFTRDSRRASASQILDNVAPVLEMLAAVFDEADRPVQLSPMAARGLTRVLDAARHDVGVALEMAATGPER